MNQWRKTSGNKLKIGLNDNVDALLNHLLDERKLYRWLWWWDWVCNLQSWKGMHIFACLLIEIFWVLDLQHPNRRLSWVLMSCIVSCFFLFFYHFFDSLSAIIKKFWSKIRIATNLREQSHAFRLRKKKKKKWKEEKNDAANV